MIMPQTDKAESQVLESYRNAIRLRSPVTFNVDDEVALRLYPDNQPRNLEIAALQKGLVLVASGVELIEEGAGFGVPIAKYADTTIFSSTAEVYLEQQSEDAVVLTKVFFLDAVSKKEVRGAFINDDFYSMFHKAFEVMYLNRGALRPIFDWVMQLRKMLGVKTQFVKVVPRGKVIVTYYCYGDHIGVQVNLSALDFSNFQEILLLNEQGANFFSKYAEDDEAELSGRKIGAWTIVKAEQATFSNVDGSLSFSLENRNGAVLYRGRERVKDRFSWAGMTYALNTGTAKFSYDIRISRE